jgi:homoserine dehydrogenase
LPNNKKYTDKNKNKKMSSLRVGIFGAGIVGGGVIDLVQKLNESGRFRMVGATIEIVKVCVKSLDKPRDVNIVETTTIVSDYDQILSDDSINCIVEVMGGVTDAKDVVFGAIKKGKHVITANKALVAAFLPEIQKLLLEHPTVK